MDSKLEATRQSSKQARFCRKLVTFVSSTMSLFCLVFLLIVAGGFLFVNIEGPPQRQRQKAAEQQIKQCRDRLLNQNTEAVNLGDKAQNNLKKIIVMIKGIQIQGRVSDVNKYKKNYTAPFSAFDTNWQLTQLQREANKIDDLIFKPQPKTAKLVQSDSNSESDSIESTMAKLENDSFGTVLDLLIKVAIEKSTEGVVLDTTGDGLNRTVLWTLPSAILYSVTVITTIGYGNIVPVTRQGKIATMIYAMIGIPLMLMFLTNLGSLLAMLLKVLFQKIHKWCHCFTYCWRYLIRRPSQRAGHRVNSCQSCSSVSSRNIKSVCMASHTLLDSKLELLESRSTKLSKITEESLKISTEDHNSGPLVEKRLNFTISIKTDDFNKNISKKFNQQELPLYISLFIFLIYILIGALCISYWETWDYLDSCYFVFITFTTIGFGDLVPGFVNCQWRDQTKPVICAIYLLLGLALLSMCFQLMQDRIKSRARYVGQQIGLLASTNQENKV